MSSVDLLVKAAHNTVRPITADGIQNIPLNCHEAVLGWLLLSLKYPNPWSLLRLAARRHDIGGITKQFTGPWMVEKIYGLGTRVDKTTVVRDARQGDVLYCGHERFPSHSMVVVYRDDAAVNIRGFNNEGTFRHCIPPPIYMQYDNIDRIVNDARLWSKRGKFGAAEADLFLVRHDDARRGAARFFPWEGSTMNEAGTHEGWYYKGNEWHSEYKYG